MPTLEAISPFPNDGVRLLGEDEYVAIWEEVFEPGVATAPHRHQRDYVAILPEAGELTLIHLAGDPEEYMFFSGRLEALPSEEGRQRFGFPACTVFRSKVPTGGVAHIAVNEGARPVPMILIEIKGRRPISAEGLLPPLS